MFREKTRTYKPEIQGHPCADARENLMTESRSALPPCSTRPPTSPRWLLVIGPGQFIWFYNPWGVICANIFYNVPFVALGMAVFLNPDSKGLW